MDYTEFTTALKPYLGELQALLWPETVDHDHCLRVAKTLRKPAILEKMSILSRGDEAVSFLFQWDEDQFGSIGVHLGQATKLTPYRRAFGNGNRPSHQRARKFFLNMVKAACKNAPSIQNSCIIRDHPIGGDPIFVACRVPEDHPNRGQLIAV